MATETHRRSTGLQQGQRTVRHRPHEATAWRRKYLASQQQVDQLRENVNALVAEQSRLHTEVLHLRNEIRRLHTRLSRYETEEGGDPE